MKKTAYELIEQISLEGSVFLVTGGYSGLGAVNVRALLKAKATVIATGRNRDLQDEFAKSCKADPALEFEENKLDTSHTVDLGDLDSVKAFSAYVRKNYSHIDCLINNAGVMYTAAGKTVQGFETQMGINVIGHFLLSKNLADQTSRQIWLSSKGHTRLGSPRIDLKSITEVDSSNYNTQLRYQQSKLGNILLAKQFAIEYPHLTSVSVHPGLVKTNLGRNSTFTQLLLFTLANPLMAMNIQSPEMGASTQVYLATLPVEELVNGAYYAECKVIQESESARNLSDAKMLFEFCDEKTTKFQL